MFILSLVAPAGEEAGPDYVWQALLELGAQRIDHGIHSLEDPVLVQYMAQHHIPITLCPISNLKLQVGGASMRGRTAGWLAPG
jgi:adenosine deaminase